MFRNHIKIALRNLQRNKIYSFINIVGLAIGMATCLLIMLFVKDELSYDRFFKNKDRIFQVNISGNFGGNEFSAGATPPPAGKTMASEFPEIETFTRIYKPGDVTVKYLKNGKTDLFFTESRVMAADSNFFKIFDYKMLEGNAQKCLQSPNSIVITEKMSLKYFGKTSALGQIITLDNTPMKITGVLENIPAQSSLQFDFLTSIKTYPIVAHFDWSWVWLQTSTYLLLKESPNDYRTIAGKLEKKFPVMVKNHAADAFRRIGQSFDDFMKKGGKWDFSLQPLSEVHLYSAGIQSGMISNQGDIKYVYIFSCIALFIVILACVNFMNLSTARSLKRAREVGVRKVLGSFKSGLIQQFLTESMLYSILASGIGLVLVSLTLPVFSEISGKTLHLETLLSGKIILFIISVTFIIGLLSGSYPAFYLTSFKPVNVLKGGILKNSISSSMIRNGLVVFQFSVATILIISTIIIYQQLRFTQTKDLGLDKENVAVLTNAQKLGKNQEAFRQELLRLPEVLNASISTSIPTRNYFADFYNLEESPKDKQTQKDITLSSYTVDYDFVPTLKIKLLQGRNFSKDFPSDSAAVILNETAAKQIGWKEPIGKYMTYPGNADQKFKVIGIAKDFDIESVRTSAFPFAIFHQSSHTYQTETSYITIRLKAGNLENSLQKLKSKWQDFSDDVPFDYTFLDNAFESLYRSEQQMQTIFGIFTGLAIFISCLGLFGLATYTTEQRNKEIGIRKVLGSSANQIVALLSKDFLKLVSISIVIASPVAWFVVHKWLQDFAYQIPIPWWAFVSAGVLSVSIALLTVSYQAVKAALANPVKSLRTE